MKSKTPGAGFALLAVLLVAVLAAPPAAAQEASDTKLTYQMPPQAIADLVDAPVTPSLVASPDRQWAVLAERQTLPSIAELSQPELRIGGLRINPRTNGPSRGYYYVGLRFHRIDGGEELQISSMPQGALISNIRWSPDSRKIAFCVTVEDEIQLWVASVDEPEARRLGDLCLNDTYYSSAFEWMPCSGALVCRAVGADRGPAPEAGRVPAGPVIQANEGEAAPAPTFQDLLASEHDEALFEYYLGAEVALVMLDGRALRIGAGGLVISAEPSPDGQYILVQTIHRPFSYLVPAYRFPCRVEIWDREGNVVKLLADLPLAERVPIDFDAVPAGPRSFGWRADADATVYWAEAQDGGDPKVEAEVRDCVFMLAAPFDGQPGKLADLALRYRSVSWGSDDLALVSSFWWKTRWVRTWVVCPGRPGSEPRMLFDRSYEDRYNDPGSPVRRQTDRGTWVLQTAGEGSRLFLFGRGASPEGERPFFDELDLASGETTRRWRSQAPHYEAPLALLDDGNLLLTSREAVDEPPNYFLRDLAADRITQLTEFPHPMPQLAGVTKELITYKRADGVDLSATLYLPPGYSPEQGPLPLLMWAYPREFKSARAASQVSGSPYSFVRVSPSSALVLLAHGYAILYGPTMPIIGEGDAEPNDTYVEQLVASAQAAVDEVVRRGVADPERLAIGGHSYGAFMVANLLAHSDLFAAGVARSGAYNRTLTPFGFQSEERTYWQAPDVYFNMSPFMHAQKVNEPILLIHGMADNNSGTFPLQSRRYYHALKGHGAVARLVQLPHESHGYRARESVMHVQWETARWLDRYVKGEGSAQE